MTYLDEKFGKCTHHLPKTGEISCPNITARLHELEALKENGLAFMRATTNCQFRCKRVEYFARKVSEQATDILHPGEEKYFRLVSDLLLQMIL